MLAAAEGLSPEVRAMIEAAIASGDKTAAETVIRYAKQADPAGAREIGALEDKLNHIVSEKEAAAAEEKQRKLADGNILDNWKGQVELGAYRSTGNTDNLGVYGSLDLAREGFKWRHKISGRVELQRTNGATSTERANASYQPNYKFNDRLYSFGLAQYEHDPFSGYDGRYTLGGGVGYGVLASDRLHLDLEGGPAVRHVDPTDDESMTHIIGRASLGFKWKIAPGLQIANNDALYLEESASNASSVTSLDASLIGALKLRLSYNVQYESNSAARETLDTQTRTSLVFSF